MLLGDLSRREHSEQQSEECVQRAVVVGREKHDQHDVEPWLVENYAWTWEEIWERTIGS